MKKLRDNVTCERLRCLLNYDPETGFFSWRPNPKRNKAWHTRWSGKRAGYFGPNSHAYVQIYVDGCLYLGHRLAWLYVYGGFPTFDIDHIDGDPANNRIENLREATVEENLRNMKLKVNNTSGFKGVSWDNSRSQWMAHIKVKGVRIFSKRFDFKQDAIDAIREARKKYHGEFANHG